MIDRFCENLLQKVRDRKAVYVNTVASGFPKTIEEYRLLCGKIHGIEECESLIKDLFRQVFEEKPVNELARRPDVEREFYESQ